MDDFGLLMGELEPAHTERIPYTYLKIKEVEEARTSDVIAVATESEAIEDFLCAYPDDSAAKGVEAQEKSLLGQLDVLNTLISKIQDAKKPTGTVSQDPLAVTDIDDSAHPSDMLQANSKSANTGLSSPEGKRTRKPNPRFLDAAPVTGTMGVKPVAERAPKYRTMDQHGTDNQGSEQGHSPSQSRRVSLDGQAHPPQLLSPRLPASTSYMVGVQDLQTANELAMMNGEDDKDGLLEDEDNMLIQADDLHVSQFDAGFGWGNTGEGFVGVDGVYLEDGGSGGGDVKHKIKGSQHKQKVFKSSSSVLAQQTPLNRNPANSHKAAAVSPLAPPAHARQPGKRQSKPNPKFNDDNGALIEEKKGCTTQIREGQVGNKSSSAAAVARLAAARVRTQAAMRPKVLGGGDSAKGLSAGADAAARVKRQRDEEGRYRSIQHMNGHGGMLAGEDTNGFSNSHHRGASNGKKARLSYLGHHSTNGASNGMEHHHHQSRPNHHNGRNGMQHAESDEEDSDGDEFDDDDDMDLKPRKSSSKGMLAVGEGHGRRSKHHNPWALEEAEALVEGVAQCGGGKWADIKKLGFPAIESRSAVDLKDKWRNLLRIAMLPCPPAPKSGDKKREIPASLLNWVRELAARAAKNRPPDGRSNRGRGSRMGHDSP